MSLSAIRIMVVRERKRSIVQRPPKLKSHRFSRSHGFVSTDFKWIRTLCEVIVSLKRFAEKGVCSLRRKVIEFNSLRSSKKLFKINDGMVCNCLSAASMLFHESHRSSKLGAVPPKTSCIIFSMTLHPKPSQKIIQFLRTPK